MKKKNKKIEDKILYIIIFFILLFAVFIFSLFITGNIFAKENIKIDEGEILNSIAESENLIDIEKILNENSQHIIKEEKVTEIIDLEYTTQYIETDKLPKGTLQVLQEGNDGKQEATIIKKFENDELISEEVKSNVVIKASSKKIVQVGTSNTLKMSKIVEESEAYVSSVTLNLKEEPTNESEKIRVLKQNDKVFVLEELDNWYKIEYDSMQGYVAKDCLKSEIKADKEKEYTKEQLLNKLAIDMPLNEPSYLSLEQFTNVLSGNTTDKNNIFEKNAEYFYYLEQQYKINGIFVASIGIHESAWGTSSLAKNKNNLFRIWC